MREIKFRAWYKEREMMSNIFSVFEVADGFIDFGNFIYGYGCDVEIMQYTGLKDKNGKEIYEGDILKLSLDKIGKNYHLFQVIYNEPECRYKLRFVDSTCNLIEERFYDFNISKIYEFNGEVIGNIYEDKQLLDNQLRQS